MISVEIMKIVDERETQIQKKSKQRQQEQEGQEL